MLIDDDPEESDVDEDEVFALKGLPSDDSDEEVDDDDDVEEDEEGRKGVMKPGRPDTAYPSGKGKYKKKRKQHSRHTITTLTTRYDTTRHDTMYVAFIQFTYPTTTQA